MLAMSPARKLTSAGLPAPSTMSASNCAAERRQDSIAPAAARGLKSWNARAFRVRDALREADDLRDRIAAEFE